MRPITFDFMIQNYTKEIEYWKNRVAVLTQENNILHEYIRQMYFSTRRRQQQQSDSESDEENGQGNGEDSESDEGIERGSHFGSVVSGQPDNDEGSGSEQGDDEGSDGEGMEDEASAAEEEEMEGPGDELDNDDRPADDNEPEEVNDKVDEEVDDEMNSEEDDSESEVSSAWEELYELDDYMYFLRNNEQFREDYWQQRSVFRSKQRTSYEERTKTNQELYGEHWRKILLLETEMLEYYTDFLIEGLCPEQYLQVRNNPNVKPDADENSDVDNNSDDQTNSDAPINPDAPTTSGAN